MISRFVYLYLSNYLLKLSYNKFVVRVLFWSLILEKMRHGSDTLLEKIRHNFEPR